MLEIRKISKNEMRKALKLVWQTFLECEAPYLTCKGVNEFKKTLGNIAWVEQRDFYGAFDETGVLLGVVATKCRTHIALFFVDSSHQRQGIGIKLLAKIKSLNERGFFTVNSSEYAHEIYKHLGFVDTSKKRYINGLEFYPMKWVFDKSHFEKFKGDKTHGT